MCPKTLPGQEQKPPVLSHRLRAAARAAPFAQPRQPRLGHPLRVVVHVRALETPGVVQHVRSQPSCAVRQTLASAGAAWALRAHGPSAGGTTGSRPSRSPTGQTLPASSVPKRRSETSAAQPRSRNRRPQPPAGCNTRSPTVDASGAGARLGSDRAISHTVVPLSRRP